MRLKDGTTNQGRRWRSTEWAASRVAERRVKVGGLLEFEIVIRNRQLSGLKAAGEAEFIQDGGLYSVFTTASSNSCFSRIGSVVVTFATKPFLCANRISSSDSICEKFKR